MIDLYRWIYLMQHTPKGWFVKMQLDEQFTEELDEVKELFSTIMRFEKRSDKTLKVRYRKVLWNIEGYFKDDVYAERQYEIFLSRMFNKPKNYV